jgi:endonuclease-3
MNLEEIVTKIINLLENEYKNAKIALQYHTPLELLISTILSAQCTDKQVNKVTKILFKKYRTAKDYAITDLETLQKYIHSTGFYRNKAKNIKKTSRILVERYDSQVPRTMSELVILPGVGRKTANIVLQNAYGITVGIAVDTHVKRLTKRLGLTINTNPEKIEKDLMEIVSREQWGRFSNLLIFHGRRVCKSKKPECEKCVLNSFCPSAFSFH